MCIFQKGDLNFNITICESDNPCVWMFQFENHWTDFYEIWQSFSQKLVVQFLFLRKLCQRRVCSYRNITQRSGVEVEVRSKAILVTGRGGIQGCETSRISHFLDNRHIDGDEVVSLKLRQRFTPQKDSWYSYLSQYVTWGGIFPALLFMSLFAIRSSNWRLRFIWILPPELFQRNLIVFLGKSLSLLMLFEQFSFSFFLFLSQFGIVFRGFSCTFKCDGSSRISRSNCVLT
jgi:hypothetical protein